ncbi:MAG: 30S ribosomal protein S2 [Candidatus Jettenia sp.]|nr:MAG: 30S ribosomal protein S2 [Candidatus Brocadia sp. AMX2]MBC6930249.1 30S ribosomal protein S2 [Candidatus Jettenia sp.]MDL1939854.1 30S ribosomal protein S2 [Candidatus Jettenia sp. AMX1]NUN24808.1 30S ribosomal protein S2 [Candidatus Jettenia caeni]MCQ3927122.1 30S ribosomal protein S2 [Candidatus Jettenia sp.]
MSIVSVQELIDAGFHFGHRTSRWNPKMKPYIYGKRNLIHIINLRETVRGLVIAQKFLTNLAQTNKDILFVGTKWQARDIVIREAQRSGMHYVSERWLGGTLTNFDTIRKRLERLDELESMEQTGAINQFSKKAISSLNRERKKILSNLEGIRKMTSLPSALIIVDPRHEHNAVSEARKLGIPTVCLADTDCDPDMIDVCVPGNDDAIRSINLFLTKTADAILVGKEMATTIAKV